MEKWTFHFDKGLSNKQKEGDDIVGRTLLYVGKVRDIQNGQSKTMDKGRILPFPSFKIINTVRIFERCFIMALFLLRLCFKIVLKIKRFLREAL